MTFEEAIRALQRANTKARLKPLAKAAAQASAAEALAPTPSPVPAEDAPELAASDVPPTEPASTFPQQLGTQSADEILAAARARIQKRSAATIRTQPSILREPPPSPEPAAEAALVVDGDDPYSWVSVSGPAELVDEGAVEHIHELSRRYNGTDYSLREGEQRVIVRITPEHVTLR